MKVPEISIITVVYNGADVIEKTIRSVIEQHNKNNEYIIIDGGSTDGTIDIIKKYEDKIDLWISESDKGIFDAMNKGVELAKGKYIALLNAGDYYESHVLKKVEEIISRNQDAGVIYGDTNLIIPVGNNLYSLNIIPNTVVDERLMIAPVFCHQSSFVKRDLFLRLGYFDNVSIAGDWLHFIKLYKNQVRFLYINETISNYLEGGASTTAKGFKESFKFKKEFGTFRNKDYLTLVIFHLKDNAFFKRYLSSVLWKLKILKNKSKYKKLV